MIECNICFKRGDKTWVSWHKEHTGHSDFTVRGKDEEPPSEGNKSNPELHILDSRGLCGIGFGSWGNTQSRYPFRSLVHICVNR